MDKKRIYTEDLINEGHEPIIIRQESGGDKKFLYTLLILLIILFLIVIGVIAFIGLKYFGNGKGVGVGQTQSIPQYAPPPIANQTPQVAPSNIATSSSAQQQVTSSKVAPLPQTKTPLPQDKASANADIKELENILATQAPASSSVSQTKVEEKKEESAINKSISSAAAATGVKKLSAEEMAQIAKLVALELAKVQKEQQAKGQTLNVKGEDSELVKSLEEAEIDTLEEQNFDLAKVQAVSSGVKAKDEKKEDTFNKVIVEAKDNNSEDEFAKLTQEIDAILQTEEVQQKKEKLEFKKELEEEAQRREKSLRFIVVKPGDTLSSIAQRAYGRASAYIKIYKANPDLIKNPNKISVWMKLRVPVDEEYVGR